MMKTRIDRTGVRYGRLTALEFDHVGPRGNAHWRCVCDCGETLVVNGASLSDGNTKSCGCTNHARPRPAAVRFAEKYALDGECWMWAGGVLPDGYGTFWDGERVVRAHRFAYELHVCPIPADAEIHHLCSEPRCVNPMHLIAVSRADHVVMGQRRFACKRGHQRRPQPNGQWECPTCRNDQQRAYQARKRMAP